MKKETNWKIEYCTPAPSKELVRGGFTPLLSIVLQSRGICTQSEAEKFINVDNTIMHDPISMLGMEKAVYRIKEAIEHGEKIAVFGDYDVDGITSTALLTDYLASRGVDVLPYIPSRGDEGYGLNITALDEFKNSGITLVITVDCGITSKEEAEYASSLGIDMIVTDHHECKKSSLPSCVSVVDCKQDNDKYPFDGLAGVGMAFKLVCAIDENPSKILDEYCDLIAIGTVADVMPLRDENRYFVKKGLEKLNSKPRIGIQCLLADKSDKVSPHESKKISKITSQNISFSLAPKLNAAGRMDSALDAEKLFSAKTEEEAEEIVNKLNELNNERKKKESAAWDEAKHSLESNNIDTTKPIVIANDNWHPGVIGIVASRLAEHYGIPAIIISLKDNVGKGSCRSYGNFNLYSALQECSSHLISFGGHALAAGLNIEKNKIDIFHEKLCEYYISHPSDNSNIPSYLLINDSNLLSVENVTSLDYLEPFGNLNEAPVFCIMSAVIESQNLVGGDKHLKLKIHFDKESFDCIYFSFKDTGIKLAKNDCIDIAFTPKINEYYGKPEVQLTISAIRPHDSSELCENIQGCCSYINALKQFRPVRKDFVNIWPKQTATEKIDDRPSEMQSEKYWICRKVFEQSGLIDKSGNILHHNKVNLEETPLMKELNEL